MSKTTQGFSLLEVMVAAALLASMGALLFSTLHSAVQVRERVEPMSDRYHLVRAGMGRMVKELSMAYFSAQKSPDESTPKTKFVGDRKEISFSAFGNSPGMADVKQSDQVQIRYFLGDDKKTKTTSLMREIEIDPGLRTDKKKIIQTLCPDVTALEFQYWNDGNNGWDDEWKTEGAAKQEALPTRVRISLTVTLPDKREQKLLTEAPIWLSKPLQIK